MPHLPTASRRAVVLAGVLAPLTACSALDFRGPGTEDAEPAHLPDPDRQLRNQVADAERALVAQYRATADVHPDLADALADYISRHEQHLTAVLATTPRDAQGTEPPDTAAGEAPGESGEPEVPARQEDAVAALRGAEMDAAANRILDCTAALDHELAQTLASVAGCEAAHDRLLRALA